MVGDDYLEHVKVLCDILYGVLLKLFPLRLLPISSSIGNFKVEGFKKR